MKVLKRLTLIQKIIIGIIIGAILGMTVPSWTAIGILGDLFINALKAIAPLLVFILIINSLAQQEEGQKTHMKTVIVLYLIATFVAALTAVFAAYLFPVKIVLPDVAVKETAPQSLAKVLTDILNGAVMNPVEAITEGSYLALLFWGCLFGFTLRYAGSRTKEVLRDLTNGVQNVVQLIIQFVPFGIVGLVFRSVAEIGVKGLVDYGRLIFLVVGTMFFVGLVVYPLMTFILLGQNPYPLNLYCLKESGIPAFFTRSSAVNIPINMELCKKLGLSEESYSVSIPLGATANSGGAAITISLMT
ncbi:MAG TPA: serine/threonine transporter SstT, partial [Tetragenococcus sp.]|nr:serine/threonine transporter SstT [Tetragenococcus sp.]